MPTLTVPAHMIGMRSLCAFLFVVCATPLAYADDDAAVHLVRRSFTSDADADVIRRAACSLDARGTVAFSMRVDSEPCPGASTQATAIVVTTRLHDGEQEVIVEARLADDASADDVVIERTASALEALLREPPVKARGEKRVWYGWQIVLSAIAIDVAGTAAVIGVDAATNNQIAPLAVTATLAVSARVFMPAVIHALQHDADKVAWSLALEIGLPVATALTALGLTAIATNGRVEYPLNSLAIGAAPGAFIATIIDAAAFSTKHVTPKRRDSAVTVLPTVGPTRAGLDLVATF
jgi:hypothetical protein